MYLGKLVGFFGYKFYSQYKNTILYNNCSFVVADNKWLSNIIYMKVFAIGLGNCSKMCNNK